MARFSETAVSSWHGELFLPAGAGHAARRLSAVVSAGDMSVGLAVTSATIHGPTAAISGRQGKLRLYSYLPAAHVKDTVLLLDTCSTVLLCNARSVASVPPVLVT